MELIIGLSFYNWSQCNVRAMYRPFLFCYLKLLISLSNLQLFLGYLPFQLGAS